MSLPHLLLYPKGVKKKKPHCTVYNNKLLTLQAAATKFTYTRAMDHGYSPVEQKLSI